MKKISLLIKKKYSYSSLSIKEIKRLFLKKKNILKNVSKIKKEKLNYKLKNNINTFEFLKYLFSKKKITDKENKIFVGFYEKFNVNLKLKKIYSKNLKKKTNLNCKEVSYIYLSLLIPKIKRINNLHKLNSILKINDMLLLSNFKKSKEDNLLKHSLLNEIKYLKSYL